MSFGQWSQNYSTLSEFHYYWQYINNYTFLVVTITALTPNGANPKHWPLDPVEALHILKQSLSSGSALMRPDTTKTFSINVNAASVGFDAILFQTPVGLGAPSLSSLKSSPQQRRFFF